MWFIEGLVTASVKLIGPGKITLSGI